MRDMASSHMTSVRAWLVSSGNSASASRSMAADGSLPSVVPMARPIVAIERAPTLATMTGVLACIALELGVAERHGTLLRAVEHQAADRVGGHVEAVVRHH